MVEVKKETPKAEEVKPKSKRGSYRQKECPYCHKHVGNLPNHIAALHKTEQEEQGLSANPPVLTKEDLLNTRAASHKETKPEDQIYYCADCKAELRKGEQTCWHCGATLDWEGL